MQERHWHQVLMSLMILGTFTSVGLAQEGTGSVAAGARSGAALSAPEGHSARDE